MVSVMETNPAEQLEGVRRLRTETLTEARKIPRGAFVIQGVALVVWFTGFGLLGPEKLGLEAAVWIALWWIFFVSWSLWVRQATRARQPTDALTRGETLRRVVEWTAFFALGQAIVWFGSRVSWILVGVLLALLMVGQGLFNRAVWLRWRRS